jgi:hypothetical protein
MSTARIEAELNLLKSWFGSALEYIPDGHWVLLRDYEIPSDLWTPRVVDVCFQIPSQLPGQPPYGFYVRPDVVAVNGAAIGNHTGPVSTGFGDDWCQMSWSVTEEWRPAATPEEGSNMVSFALSFADRFTEGP